MTMAPMSVHTPKVATATPAARRRPVSHRYGMKSPGTSLIAVAMPTRAPRGQRGCSTMQSKMQHAISGMPTWPNRRWSSTGDSAHTAARTSTNAIGAGAPEAAQKRVEARAHDRAEHEHRGCCPREVAGLLGDPRERRREQGGERRVDERQRRPELVVHVVAENRVVVDDRPAGRAVHGEVTQVPLADQRMEHPHRTEHAAGDEHQRTQHENRRGHTTRRAGPLCVDRAHGPPA